MNQTISGDMPHLAFSFQGSWKNAAIRVSSGGIWARSVEHPRLHRPAERLSNMRLPNISPGLINFEHRRHPVISPQRFAVRLLKAIGLWLVLAVVGLLIGMAGYIGLEGMSVPDAYVNAAMILSGMGPLGELKTTAGKIFAGSYAIFSGLVIVIATGFVLAPIFHRVLHRFHVEAGEENQ